MKKIVTTLSLVVIVLALSLPLASTTLAAGPNCTASITDEANMFGTNSGDVQKAVDALNKKGADTKVYTFAGYDKAKFRNLEDYIVKTLIPGCSQWQSGLRNNAVIVVVSKTPGETYLGTGSDFDRVINEDVRGTIRRDVMNKKFSQGDFAGGIVAGLTELGKSVDLKKAPVGASNVTVQNQAATDLSGLWTVLIIGILVVVVLIFLLVILPSRRKNQEGKAGAQQAAKNARGEAVERVTELPQTIEELKQRVEFLVIGGVSDTTLAVIKSKLLSTENLVNNATTAVADLQNVSDPDDNRLSESQYRELERSYKQRVLERTESAQLIIQQVSGWIGELEKNPKAKIAELPTPKPNPKPKPPVTSSPLTAEPPLRSTAVRRQIDKANQAICDAEGYIRANWYYTSYEAKEKLRDAREFMERTGMTYLNNKEAEELAVVALDKAKRALSIASNDVSSGVDQRRKPAYYDPWEPWYPANTTIVVLNSPDHSWSREHEHEYSRESASRRDEQNERQGGSDGWSSQLSEPSHDIESQGGSGKWEPTPSSNKDNESRGGSDSWGNSNNTPDPEPAQETPSYEPPNEPTPSYDPEPSDSGGSDSFGSSSDD